jgi:hypothetical protein
MSDYHYIAIDVDVHRIIEASRKSFGESKNDILRRLLLPDRPKTRRSLIRTRSRRRSPMRGTVNRARGLWSVEVNGERVAATNMKDAYRLLLLQLEDFAPGFLERFSVEGNGRRRFVARSAAALYASSPHLARDHARHLTDDWFFDTNLSTEQVARRARVAARVAGLAYGRNVRLLDNLREI